MLVAPPEFLREGCSVLPSHGPALCVDALRQGTAHGVMG